ncbi:MAG TPA: chorismate mutase [Flavitalea sp.]|nr:chorismate mutase [Flavitalea sp.]
MFQFFFKSGRQHRMVMLTLIACIFLHHPSHAQGQKDQDLSSFRHEIDSLDHELIHLLGQREKVVKEVGEYKAENHIPPLQQKRFDQLVARAIVEGEKEDLSSEFIRELMNAIHKESLRIEKEIAVDKKDGQ